MTLDEAKEVEANIEDLTRRLNAIMAEAAVKGLTVFVTNHTRTNMNGTVSNMLVIDTMIKPDNLEA